MSLQFKSPAKINLFLHVHGKRDDGYHSLSSLIQTVSLFDCIAIGCEGQDRFTCSVSKLEHPHNLALRARDLFREKTGWRRPLAITLEKRIPQEAGLGGGSGNAATILFAMNRLSGLKIPESTLQTWSGELGSDVPFFFSHGTALCEGRGEIVTDLAPLPQTQVTVVKPACSLKTPEVFSAYRAPSAARDRSRARLSEILEGKPNFENDLESAALSLAPDLASVRRALREATPHSSMTGSGSSFYCLGHHSVGLDIPTWKLNFHHRQPGEWY